MGGTMDYARFRNRNVLTYRKPIDDTQPYNDSRDFPEYLSDTEKNKLYMLTGDLNRMEKNILGLDGSPVNTELNTCANATGVDHETILKVMRWFLNYPEPYCPDCMKQMQQNGKDDLHWRCVFHTYGPPKG